MEFLHEDGRSGRSTGVLPTTGAVPVVDQSTGKVRMERVKVQRYIAGLKSVTLDFLIIDLQLLWVQISRPNYAGGGEDDDEDVKGDIKEIFEAPVPETSKSIFLF